MRKYVEQRKIERDIQIIRKENDEYRQFLLRKKEEVFSSEYPSENIEKFKRLFNEKVEYTKQITEYGNKINRNFYYIQDLKKKLLNLKEEFESNSMIQKHSNPKLIGIIEKVLLSIEKELEGTPTMIFDRINNNLLTRNKERKELIGNFDINERNNLIKSSSSINQLKKLEGDSITISKNPLLTNHYDKCIFENESFENNIESKDRQESLYKTNCINENKYLDYENINEYEYLDIVRRKEVLVLENERIEKLVLQNKDENDKITCHMKISMEHQQKRLIMLREQNEFLSKEINDLMQLIVLKYNQEKIKNEITKIAMTYDKNPEESNKKLAILNDIYNTIKKQKNI